MTRDVVAVHPETPVSDLVGDLVRRHFRAVPVVDSEGGVVGIVTGGDLVRRGVGTRLELLRTYEPPALEEQLSRLAVDARQTSEVMTSPVETVRQEADVRHAAELMRDRNLRRLPVVDAGGRLVGLLSRVDLLRAVAPVPAATATEEPHPEHIDASAPVSTIMSTSIPTVGADAPLSEVVNVVLGNRMRRAVVVDHRGHVLGIIRDLELTDRLTPEHPEGFMQAIIHRLPFAHGDGVEKQHPPAGNRARDLMLTDIAVARQDEPVGKVLSRMMEKGRTIAPVVNDADELVGVVYRPDVLDALVEA
jgi:CBS domain-containing protein